VRIYGIPYGVPEYTGGKDMAVTYKDSGVDVTAGYRAIELMKKHVRSTYTDAVFTLPGKEGGFIDAGGGSLLFAGTDGVGTKLKYAFIMDRHDTIGIDCVAMCANDVLCRGAMPVMFLDYIAVPKLIPEKVEQIVKGVAEGCRQAGCALVGGETAELAGFYAENEYDVAGFCVGTVNKKDVISGGDVRAGDVLIGLASSGVHSNGYTLVRRLFGEEREKLDKHCAELGGNLADILLTPTRIYVKSVLEVMGRVKLKALAHITGGGLIEKLPRALPENTGAKIDTKSYPLPRVFSYMRELAGLADEQAYNTFNMGIGMAAAVDKADADKALRAFAEAGETAYVIGEVKKGGGVTL
jgi:phosphoribosylformylglycinamidine cyclo-ligase